MTSKVVAVGLKACFRDILNFFHAVHILTLLIAMFLKLEKKKQKVKKKRQLCIIDFFRNS